MDIIVEGKANKFFKPDCVNFNITFYTKSDTYENALENGTYDVNLFITNVLEKLNIEKSNLKTRSFKVSEISRYDYEEKKHYKDGFSYTQYANLKMDYDMAKVGSFMDEISKLKNPPTYRIDFMLKNEEKAKSLVIAEAYTKAEEKAKMIALASGKKLKDCLKVDFRPFDEAVTSNTEMSSFYTGNMLMKERKSTAETIQNIFTPEDVEISETLYCLWLAE